MSTHVSVERENAFFQFSTSASFGRSEGGVDSTYGSNWNTAHEKLFALIEHPTLSALMELKKGASIGIAPLKDEARSCSGWADRGIPQCRAGVAITISKATLGLIEAHAPPQFLEGTNSVYGGDNEDPSTDQIKLPSGPTSNRQISLRAATQRDAIQIQLSYVAKSDPDGTLAKRIQAAVESAIAKEARSKFPNFKPSTPDRTTNTTAKPKL